MSASSSLLANFIRHYPFQPATAYWRAIEIEHVVAFPFPEGRGLDLGCGDGKLTLILNERIGSRQWVGIDLDPGETELARRTGLYEEVDTGSANQVPESDGAFDFVFSNSVLEHIPDLDGTLAELSRLLKKGGSFLFTVPSDQFHRCLWGPLLSGQDRAAYLRDLDYRCAHLRYLSSEQWTSALSAAGLQVSRVTRYLDVAQTRRWESISRLTAGILFAGFGKRKHPIEIQKSLGLRRQGFLMPTIMSRLFAFVASLGAPPDPERRPRRNLRRGLPNGACQEGMNVLVVTHYYASHGGGIEAVAEKLIGELCLRGIQVQWAASDVDEPPRDVRGLRTLPMSASNVTETRLGFPYPLWSPGSLFRLARAINEADVVHLHDSLYLGNVWAFLVAKAKRRPVLVTQHIGEVPYRSRTLRMLMRTANATLGRSVLSRADLVVFIGHQVRQFYEGRFRFRNKPLLVMNGVDATAFACESGVDERRHVRETLGLDADRPVFLFVGRFVEKKGLPLLKSLAAALPHVQWMFAGSGPLDPSKWGLPQVRVFHRCSPETLRTLYIASDLLVLPSVGEGFPLVVQESMACGTPVIVGDETAAACPLAGELILHENVEGSAAQSAWLNRLEALLSTPELLDELRPQVAAFARHQWSWSRAAAAYEQCYRRLIVARHCSEHRDSPSADELRRG